jgi:putative ABC transport system permease protein
MYSINLIAGIIERGIIFSILIIGMHISSRVIKFENLSIEGGFGLGGAVCAVLLSYGINPWISLFVAPFISGLSGVLTGMLHYYFHISRIMSGIIVSSGLFSIILKLAGSNMVLDQTRSIFFSLENNPFGFINLLIIFTIALISVFFIRFLLKSQLGLLLYAAGNNPQIITTIGKNATQYSLIGLFFSNFFAGLSHALFINYMGYFSIWFGSGIIITGMAGLILSEILTNHCNYLILTGGILYQIIIAATFEFQIHPDWNKLITATLLVIALCIKKNNNELTSQRG